ncbi:MAG: hypothetical protein AAF449_13085, partial [Myxococcota bacterium]
MSVSVSTQPSVLPQSKKGVVRDLVVVALKLSAAQLAPLLASVYVAGIVARQGKLPFSAYTLVTSVNITAFIAASSFLQALYYVGGMAVGKKDREAYLSSIVAAAITVIFRSQSWGTRE